MKIKDLIEKLQKEDPDEQIYLATGPRQLYPNDMYEIDLSAEHGKPFLITAGHP